MVELSLFHPKARKELLERFDYQVDNHPDLVDRWVATVESVYDSVLENPLAFQQRELGHRRARLGSFPHYLAYVMRDEQVWFVAVGSSSQDSLYWKDRLN